MASSSLHRDEAWPAEARGDGVRLGYLRSRLASSYRSKWLRQEKTDVGTAAPGCPSSEARPRIMRLPRRMGCTLPLLGIAWWKSWR